MVLRNDHGYIPRTSLSFIGSQVSSALTYLSYKEYMIVVSKYNCIIESSK